MANLQLFTTIALELSPKKSVKELLKNGFTEFLIEDFNQLEEEEVTQLINDNYFIFVGRRTKKIFFCLPYHITSDATKSVLEFEEPNDSAEKHWQLYKIEKKQFHEFISNKTLEISQEEFKTSSIMSDGGADFAWEWLCGATQMNPGLPIALTCFPFISCVIGSVIHSLFYYKKQKQLYDDDPTKKKDLVAQTVKSAVKLTFLNFFVKGCWEAGYYLAPAIGSALIKTLSITPWGLWLPVAYIIGAGFMEGAGALIKEIIEEKAKYGDKYQQLKSPWYTYCKVFMTNFISGAIWQLCSMIPFGALLVNTVLKPTGQLVLNTFFQGLAAGFSRMVWTYLSLTNLNKPIKSKPAATTRQIFDKIHSSPKIILLDLESDSDSDDESENQPLVYEKASLLNSQKNSNQHSQISSDAIISNSNFISVK